MNNKPEYCQKDIIHLSLSVNGDFEQVTEGAVTSRFYYMSGDGLAAVYVRQSGQPDAICYVHTHY